MRIWILHKNSPARINLRAGQPVFINEYWTTDEGYGFTEHVYYLGAENEVCVSSASGGRDCDGEIRYYRDAAADPRDTRESKYHPGIRFPNWQDISTSVYDQYAQMAGY